MPTAIIIPFPGPRGQREVANSEHAIAAFATRYLHARGLPVNDTSRGVVARAVSLFPGGLPARRMDLERFVDFAAGPRLRRLQRQTAARD